jgi:ribonuclease HI
MKKALLYCDGASSGNPGHSGVGALIIIDNREFRLSEYIGIATNNFAEYTALIKGLLAVLKHGATSVDIRTDSELLVKQIQGIYKVKSENLTALHSRVVTLLKSFDDYHIAHIPREKNTEADSLARSAIKTGNR